MAVTPSAGDNSGLWLNVPNGATVQNCGLLSFYANILLFLLYKECGVVVKE